MPRSIPAVEHAMEVQVSLRALRSATHPLWEAAVATGDADLIAECHALAQTLRVANVQARRIAALAEPDHAAVPVGLFTAEALA
jgi:hypothetical protein